jgi:predicted metal-binding membrane protein
MTRAGVPARPGPLLTIGPLLALAVVCWAVVVQRMGGEDGGPGADPGPLGFFTGMWTLMMAAMMIPSVWPTVLVYQRLQAARRERGKNAVRMGPALLLVGYLTAWTVVGLIGFAILKAGRALDIDALSWSRGGPLLAGGVIIAAAAYQLTPLKDVCLRHCRGPFSFLFEHWRPGALGAVRMGARHGIWCIGCCWALMTALFALGVMSIPWMAVIAVFITAEKLLPWRRAAATFVSLALLVLGLAVALVPERIPGLMTADAAMHKMSMPRGVNVAGINLGIAYPATQRLNCPDTQLGGYGLDRRPLEL